LHRKSQVVASLDHRLDTTGVVVPPTSVLVWTEVKGDGSFGIGSFNELVKHGDV